MLLVEYTLLDNLEVINENTTGGTQRLKLRGRFQKCDEQNNNGRVYPRKILEGQVQAIQEKIKDRSLVGALDHPANDAIHLSQASHLITGLSVDNSGDVIGECEILSTPNGKIVESLINDGVKIGISSRGVGSVSESTKGKVVNEDFKLITFDLVSDPSTKGAFPELTESMRENSERAQAIVSQHKKDRVLMAVLENKIKEAVKKRKDKKKKGKKDFPDLSGDGKTTFKDILIGRGVIKGGKKKQSMGEGEQTQTNDGGNGNGKKPKKPKKPEPPEPPEKPEQVPFAKQLTAKQLGFIGDSANIFGKKIIEACNNILRKDEMAPANINKRPGKQSSSMAARAIAQARRAPGQTAAPAELKARRGMRRTVEQAYRNLIRKDEAKMSDYDIDKQQRMKTGDFDDRTDRDADMPTAGARQTAKSIRRTAGRARARYIAQFRGQTGSEPEPKK
tara:strand:- start:49 stop:1395 length:1347 start_codon:yes stop_codon:yes gene_type:complete